MITGMNSVISADSKHFWWKVSRDLASVASRVHIPATWNAHMKLLLSQFCLWTKLFLQLEEEEWLKQAVKEFWWEVVYKDGTIFHAGKFMWHCPIGSYAVSCSSRADSLIDFFCCVHQSNDSTCFSLCHTTPKIAVPLGGSEVYLIHGSSGPPESSL